MLSLSLSNNNNNRVIFKLARGIVTRRVGEFRHRSRRRRTPRRLALSRRRRSPRRRLKRRVFATSRLETSRSRSNRTRCILPVWMKFRRLEWSRINRRRRNLLNLRRWNPSERCRPRRSEYATGFDGCDVISKTCFVFCTLET